MESLEIKKYNHDSISHGGGHEHTDDHDHGDTKKRIPSDQNDFRGKRQYRCRAFTGNVRAKGTSSSKGVFYKSFTTKNMLKMGVLRPKCQII